MTRDFIGRDKGQDPLRIASASPERDPVPEIQFQLPGIHSPAGNLNRIYRIQSGFDQVIHQLIDASAAMQLHFHIGQLLSPPPQLSMIGFVEFSVGIGTDQGALLAAQIIAKEHHIDEGTYGRHPVLQVLQVDPAKLLRKRCHLVGIQSGGQKIVIHAVQHLGDLKHVAPENTHDGPVGGFPECPGRCCHLLQTRLIHLQMAPGVGHGAPHLPVQHLLQVFKIIVFNASFHQGEMTLFEVEASLFQYSHFGAFLVQKHPVLPFLLHVDIMGDLTGSSIGKDPGFPIAVLEQKAPSHFDAVDPEQVQHILIHNGQLLHHVIDPDGFLLQAQVLSKPVVGNG